MKKSFDFLYRPNDQRHCENRSTIIILIGSESPYAQVLRIWNSSRNSAMQDRIERVAYILFIDIRLVEWAKGTKRLSQFREGFFWFFSDSMTGKSNFEDAHWWQLLK